ncbi:nitroreductase family protein [Pararhizobium haloflavum]|uniref:nitroreductase family protein n=1 Tax=Pararhizobium haloflavum TaxID=2037914 RepID=UPI000C183071|nr:nitroreductase [Pararhizobium haloflavum]
MQETQAELNLALKQYLQTRRSTPAMQLQEPGPSPSEIEGMIAIASRVPDHGKLAPWRFIVLAGDVRERIGRELGRIAADARSDLGAKEREIEETRLTRAPVVIAVVSRAAPHPKIPEWEQVLSAGAVCYGLFMAANAFGYGANWLTEWYAYDDSARPLFGLDQQERIAGFVHIGTPAMQPADRPRPDLTDIVYWAE